tara:strand:- start:1839 stop:3110 length:1272 start_codon:yes stop_codon:yes gene_type:complete
MKLYLCALSALFFLLPTISFSAETPYDLVLETGVLHELPGKIKSPIHLDKYGILTVTGDAPHLKVRGKKTGKVKLTSANQTLNILVLSSVRYQKFLNVQKALAHRRGLSLDYSKGKLTIDGELLRAQDYLQLLPILEELDTSVEIHAVADKEIQKTIIEELGLKYPQLENSDTHHFSFESPWSLTVAKNQKDDILIDSLQQIGFKAISESKLHAKKPLVQIHIKMIETNQTLLQQMGFDWLLQSQLKIHPTPIKEQNLSQLISSFDEESALGTVLSEPILITQSGRKTEFFSGGEFATRLTTESQQSVIWKEYGLRLNATPTTFENEVTQIRISLKISTPDPGSAIDGIPTLSRKSIESFVTVRNDSFYLLSDLSQKINGLQKDSLPGLSKIPILGSFFQGTSEQEQTRKILIFIRTRTLKDI